MSREIKFENEHLKIVTQYSGGWYTGLYLLKKCGKFHCKRCYPEFHTQEHPHLLGNESKQPIEQ